MSATITLPESFPSSLILLWDEIERLSVETGDLAVYDPDRRAFLTSAGRRSFRQRFYRQFCIPKKSGGEREITAPTGYLKDTQRQIATLLGILYTAPDCVNGFARRRSVRTNAEAHLGKNYVFNTDLKDFFPSITRGMILSSLRRYGVTEDVAIYIANVCTITSVGGDDLPEDVLPQGSPASPILSNMVCYRMDRHLEWLAEKYGLRYSRYADDMTFSSMHTVYGKSSPFLKEFKDVIAKYGFRLNEEKTRLQKRGSRQEVTGIIVGDKANVCRRYIKNLRAEIFRMEMFGYTKEQYRSARGKVAFVGMVRGKEDALFCKLRARVLSLRGRHMGFIGQRW